MDVSRQQQLQADIAARLALALTGRDWAEATLFLLLVGDVAVTRVDALDATGTAAQDLAEPDVDDLGRQLREVMADPERGTWFSLVLTLSSDGSFAARFTADRRVHADPASPFEGGDGDTVPSDADYAADLARFPRSDKYWPEWLPRDGGSTTRAAPPAGAADEAAEAAGGESAVSPAGAPTAGLPASLAALDGRWGWPGVLASIAQQTASSPVASSPEAAGTGDRDAPALTTHQLAARVRDAVVLDVIAPHRVATLLRLHAEAVSAGVLPAVEGVDAVDPERSVEEARAASPEVVASVETAVSDVVDAIVADHLLAVTG